MVEKGNRKYKPVYLYPAVLMILILLCIGCSGNGGNPIEQSIAHDEQAAVRESKSDRMLWGIWNIGFDPANNEITIIPDRNALAHFDITDYLLPPNCDDCFEVVVNSFDPVTRILDADVTLRNPTQLSGYDVRGILYTNDYGHLLKNADAWTDLWEIPGGDDINPFRAFAKTEANRIFVHDAEHTENYRIYIPMPPNWSQITFAVDASWPGNCREPYGFENFVQDGQMYEIPHDFAGIYIDVLDWQDDVSEVILYSEEFADEPAKNLTHVDDNTWHTIVINNDTLGPGEYPVLIEAKSENSGELSLYQYVTVTISESPFPDLTEVTPTDLNFTPEDIFIDGNYMYVAADVNGLHIFDITDPLAPDHVGMIETSEDAMQVVVSGGYAYVAEGRGGNYEFTIEVIDVSMPESPVSVNNIIDVGKNFTGLDVSGDLLYVLTRWQFLQVIDISTPESAYILTTNYAINGYDLVITDNIAYIVVGNGLRILDVSDPVIPVVLGFVETPQWGRVVDVSGDYAYFVCSDGFYIIDVSVPESAYVISTLDTLTYGTEIKVQDSYVYISSGSWFGFAVIDVSEPLSPSIVKDIAMEGYPTDLCLYGEYAYVVTQYTTIWIMDISTPESTYVADRHDSIGNAMELEISDGYAYVVTAEGDGNLQIVDIDPPEEADIVVTVDFPYGCRGVTVRDGYAYVCGIDMDFIMDPLGFLYIVDIDPPEASQIVKTIKIADICEPSNVRLYGDYALVADHFNGVHIVKINPVETAAVVGIIDDVSSVWDLAISGEYAFLIGEAFVVADIDPIESAHVISGSLLYTPGEAIVISGDYAYTTGYVESSYSYVLDIQNPQLPEVFGHLNSYNKGNDVAVSGGYTYYAFHYGGLGIADIDPPEFPELVALTETRGYSQGIAVAGEYVYVADGNGGLRIYKLW